MSLPQYAIRWDNPIFQGYETLQIRRGTRAELLQYIPNEGEPVFSTDTAQIYVGDGVTPGGILAASGGGGSADSDQALYTTSSVTFNQITTNAITATNTLTFYGNTLVDVDNPSMVFRAGLIEFRGNDQTVDLRVQDGQVLAHMLRTNEIEGGIDLKISAYDEQSATSGNIQFITDYQDLPAGLKFNITYQDQEVTPIAEFTATGCTFSTPIDVESVSVNSLVKFVSNKVDNIGGTTPVEILRIPNGFSAAKLTVLVKNTENTEFLNLFQGMAFNYYGNRFLDITMTHSVPSGYNANAVFSLDPTLFPQSVSLMAQVNFSNPVDIVVSAELIA